MKKPVNLLKIATSSPYPKFVDHFNYNYLDTPIIDPGKSLTVPDAVLSLAEFISRFTRGLAVPQMPVQDVDTDMSYYDNLNQFERIDLRRKNIEDIKSLETALTLEQAERKRLADLEEFNKAVELSAAAKLTAIAKQPKTHDND